MATTERNVHSSYRESLLEHLFAGAVMRHLWINGVRRLEVLKPQVDDGGYDLVLEANNIIRHVQLKSSHDGSSTGDVRINIALSKKPNGWVIWNFFDSTSLEFKSFLWFGGAPGKPLPTLNLLKTAKLTKGNADGVKLERPNIRVLPKSWFKPLSTIDEVVSHLFG